MARYIDADYMKKMVDMYGTNKYGMLDENIRVFIDQMPTADVRENVHGNWVGIDDEPYTTWECDKCGCIYEEDFKYIPNFCPNCGADMRCNNTVEE